MSDADRGFDSWIRNHHLMWVNQPPTSQNFLSDEKKIIRPRVGINSVWKKKIGGFCWWMKKTLFLFFTLLQLKGDIKKLLVHILSTVRRCSSLVRIREMEKERKKKGREKMLMNLPFGDKTPFFEQSVLLWDVSQGVIRPFFSLPYKQFALPFPSSFVVRTVPLHTYWIRKTSFFFPLE